MLFMGQDTSDRPALVQRKGGALRIIARSNQVMVCGLHCAQCASAKGADFC